MVGSNFTPGPPVDGLNLLRVHNVPIEISFRDNSADEFGKSKIHVNLV